ncbi:MAG: LysR substrate-binding domain-containing protein [Pseudomonadota bacterium]
MRSRPTLPPLAAVRVFEAAARHKNFTAASEELGMTQAAVSYQVKVLEERIGEPLFQRHARGVTLTASGARLAERLTDAVNIISDAYAEARGIALENLTISSVPTFATQYLAQHIGRFHMENPDVAVRFELSDSLVDFPSSTADLAIRSGHGDWPNVIARKLIDTVTTPMLSPKLLSTGTPLSMPKDLLQFPLLNYPNPLWENWFALAGVDGTGAKCLPGHEPGAQVFEAQAAISGQGVAMLTPALFRDAIEDGQLIQPFSHEYDDGSAFWLVYPESHRNLPKIKLFRDWLIQSLAELNP